MGVGMDPEAFARGAAKYGNSSETVAGLVPTVTNLTALRQAFAGAEEAWPAVENLINALTGQIENIRAGSAHADTTLRTAGGGSATLDQNSGDAIRSTGA